MQSAQQVGDVEVEGLTVLSGQFAAVVTLGQMFQRPQQWRQTQREQGQAAPAGSAGEGRSHEHRAPVGTGALCLGLRAQSARRVGHACAAKIQTAFQEKTSASLKSAAA